MRRRRAAGMLDLALPQLGRRRLTLTDRGTIAIGALAATATVAALGLELGRVWRRGSAPLPSETDDLLGAAESAVSETVSTVVAGYRGGSTSEHALFNLFVSFVVALGGARGTAYLLRGRRRLGPFRNVVVGRRHIHHFVPGIVLAFLAGALAIVSRNERLEPLLAIPFGAGMGMTLDESALLLELEDVYWTEQGVVGVQIALAAVAILGALAVGLRFTRRGEELVLPPAEPPSAGLAGD